jgi:choline kinase
MRAVIIAAGDGGRLQPLTNETPKPLLKVQGRPLINHVLDALFDAGIRRTTVVVGYRGDQIRSALRNQRPCGMTIDFVDNPVWEEGNARSIWEARGDGGPFVLAMSDHLVEPAIVSSLMTRHNGKTALAVDHASASDARAEEATRAHVIDGAVRDLGKNIDMWNALDTGLFWCTDDVFDAMTPDQRDGEAGAVFASLARAGKLDAIDVTGMRWMDVDTPEDLRTANAWFSPSAN